MWFRKFFSELSYVFMSLIKKDYLWNELQQEKLKHS